MTNDRELMQQALEALETIAKVEHPSHKVTYRKPVNGHVVTIYPHKVASDAIIALKQALEQPEQELVCVCGAVWEGQELVSTPPQRKPLTNERIDELWELWLTTKHGAVTKTEGRIFARAIEAAHGIKGDA